MWNTAKRTSALVVLGLCELAACAGDEPGSSPQQAQADEALYGLGSLATAWPNGDVPVCWANLNDHPDLQAMVPPLLAQSWEAAAFIKFHFGACSGNHVTVQFSTQPNYRGLTVGFGSGTPTITLIAENSDHFRYEVIHEFGHALGFVHEMKRPDNWDNGVAKQCGDVPTDMDYSQYESESGGIYLTPDYDADSIMNYCSGLPTHLSAGDIAGVQLAYPTPSVAGSSGILWRCDGAACGNAVAGTTAIWKDADSGSTVWPGAVDFGWQIRGVGDFDGNGRSDILWRNADGSNSIWYDSNGNTSVWPPALDGNWQVQGIGDFDGNGNDDILWRCIPQAPATSCGGVAAGTAAIWQFANGLYGWTSWPGAVDFSWQIVGVGDFDGNGKSDILWRNTDGSNSIWYDGNGNTSVWPPALDGNWKVQGIGDFDGNGNADILWRCVPQGGATACGQAAAGSTAVWQFANGRYGSTTFPGALDFNWQLQGVGDFDNNGVSDILWRCVPQAPATACGDAIAGAVAIWRFSTGGRQRTTWQGALDFNWQIHGVGKFD